MCRGTTKKGKPCKNSGQPYCSLHMSQMGQVLPILLPSWAKFMRGPTKADGPGYIYIYSLDTDPVGSNYYKIGSSVDVEQRLKEGWKGGILKKAYYVHFRQLAERVVHLELDQYRVYRYLIETDTYCTIWKNGSKPVEASDAALKEKHQLHGFQKHVEWFKVGWEVMEGKIEIIVNLVNDKGYRRW